MPSRGTPRWAIRVPEALWQEFGAAAKPDRSEVLRAFIRWYLRKPEAELPPRP